MAPQPVALAGFDLKGEVEFKREAELNTFRLHYNTVRLSLGSDEPLCDVA